MTLPQCGSLLFLFMQKMLYICKRDMAVWRRSAIRKVVKARLHVVQFQLFSRNLQGPAHVGVSCGVAPHTSMRLAFLRKRVPYIRLDQQVADSMRLVRQLWVAHSFALLDPNLLLH